MKKYKYKDIILFCYYGTWDADIRNKDGIRYALTRCCSKTKKIAYEIAKRNIDYMNSKKWEE